MFSKFIFVFLTVLAGVHVLAMRRDLPSGEVTCANDQYSLDNISNAVSRGAQVLQSGHIVGDDSYPHQYRDEEGLQMSCSSSTYYEFPIVNDGSLYSEGSPGDDRVVFDHSGDYCAVITQTSSSDYDGFVACNGD